MIRRGVSVLIEFSVGNFRSFKNKATFSMVAANIVSKNKSLDVNNVTNYSKSLKILNCAAIYGANASGKSNLIRAISFMRNFILNSSKDTQISESIGVDSYKLSSETDNCPSSFEIIFTSESTRYRYGFEADKAKIHSEWLYKTSIREITLFERSIDSITVKSAFKEGKGLEVKTRDNALFLSVCAQFNGDISKAVIKQIKNIAMIDGIEDLSYRGYTVNKLEDSVDKIAILKMLNKFDLGISDISSETTTLTEGSLPKDMPESLAKFLLEHNNITKTVKTIHRKYDKDNNFIENVAFDLDKNESQGTQKAFSMCGPLLDVFKYGKTLIIDELDARLHPVLTRQIIKLFHDKDYNIYNSQLIFATHDTNILDNKFFRRDQIWFTEKNSYGETDLYSLLDYKIRNDASFEKDYIAGRYGAIPFIGEFKRIEVFQDAE